MRIALVGAEFEENLAVRYIWAALEQAGHEVRQIVFNDRAELEGAARELAGSGAELAGLSMVFTYRAREFADLAARARELGFGGHMVAGGHFAAFNAEDLLRDVPALDSVAIGEGEEIMCDLAAHLHDLSVVRGLVWSNAAGELVRNAPAPKPPDLDRLPYPTRKVPFDTYHGIPIVNLLSSRGCTHACAFCSIAAWHKLCGGARLRMRSPENVAEEMAQLYEQGVRIFNFHDDNFFLRSKAETFDRARALKRELDRRGVGRIAFAVKSRPDSVDEELFAYLKSMGLFRVFLGIEAGTAESLRNLGRGQTRSDNERALEIVNRLDLHACFNLLMLNPGSTLEDFAANVAFLRQHPRNPMNFCRTEIYAGTPLEKKLRKQGRLLGDYWGYDYQIADPRAQRLFDIVYPAFRERNYGDRALHHQTMSLDYEYQLLAHFLGATEALRKQVKDYVVTVNRNTCEYLEESIRAVARAPGESPATDLINDLRRRVRADNRRLGASGERLLQDIRMVALQRCRPTKDRRVGKAAAAGLAAALTLAGTGRPARSHICEAAPPWVRRQAQEDEHEAIEAQVVKEVLPRIAKQLKRPGYLLVTLTLHESGAVWGCNAAAFVHPEQRARLEMPGVVFRQRKIRAGVYRFFFRLENRRPPIQALRPVGEAGHDLIKKQVVQEVLPRAVEKVKRRRNLLLTLTLDERGSVRSCHISAFALPDETTFLARPAVVFRQRKARGGNYRFFFLPAQVKAAVERAGNAPPAGDPALVEGRLGRTALPFLARRIRPPRDIQVELWIDAKGKVCYSAVHGAELPVEDGMAIDELLRLLSFKRPEARGKRFMLPVSKAVLEALYRRGTEKFEMAPFPRIRKPPREPKSQPHERAPAPPEQKP